MLRASTIWYETDLQKSKCSQVSEVPCLACGLERVADGAAMSSWTITDKQHWS